MYTYNIQSTYDLVLTLTLDLMVRFENHSFSVYLDFGKKYSIVRFPDNPTPK